MKRETENTNGVFVLMFPLLFVDFGMGMLIYIGCGLSYLWRVGYLQPLYIGYVFLTNITSS